LPNKRTTQRKIHARVLVACNSSFGSGRKEELKRREPIGTKSLEKGTADVIEKKYYKRKQLN
jgi:hypothetical protein